MHYVLSFVIRHYAETLYKSLNENGLENSVNLNNFLMSRTSLIWLIDKFDIFIRFAKKCITYTLVCVILLEVSLEIPDCLMLKEKRNFVIFILVSQRFSFHLRQQKKTCIKQADFIILYYDAIMFPIKLDNIRPT